MQIKMKNTIGHLSNSGELAVLKELNKRGFFYQWLSHQRSHEHDILAMKNNKQIRIEVKQTSFDKKWIKRDSANSGRIYQEKLDFILVVELPKYSEFVKPKRIWVFPVIQNLNEEMVKIPGEKEFLNNFDLLERFCA